MSLKTIFNHETFTNENVTLAYNESEAVDPTVLNMFKVENVESRTVHLVKGGKTLQVLMPGEIGNNPNIDTHDPENSVPVSLVRFPFDTVIVPDDLTRIVSILNAKFQAKELAVFVKSHMAKHKDTHRYTASYTAYTALTGIVLNKEGDVIVNLHTKLGKTQRKIDLKLGTATTDVPKLIQDEVKETKRLAKLVGDNMLTGVECRAPQEFITKVFNHAKVKEFYGEEIHAKRRVSFADDPSKLNICGLMFITDESTVFDGKGASYPTGAQNLWKMLRAPADTLSSGTAKRECCITTKVRDHNEGMEIRSRSIYLPICTKPQLLCEFFTSN